MTLQNDGFGGKGANSIAEIGIPWPQVVKVIGSSIGTGFLVGAGRILTARHVVEGSSGITVEIEGSPYPVTDVFPFDGVDAALLTVAAVDDLSLPDPLPLCSVPSLPTPYVAWGYCDLGGQMMRIQGFGQIRARLDGNCLQLLTRSQAPGMSGAPIAVRIRGGGWRVAGLGSARHFPRVFLDDQSLAIGYPVDALPAEVLAALGGIVEEPGSSPSPLFASVIEEKEKKASEQDTWAKRCRIIAAVALAAIPLACALAAAGMMATLTAIIVLLAVSGLASLSIMSARDAQEDARNIRLFASTLAFVDPETDDPELLRRHLLAIARQ